MSQALLIVDVQNDYFPGGRMELVGSREAGQQAGELLAAFRAARLPVIHVQHISVRPGATFFLPGTEGIRIHEAVAPREGEPIFEKSFPNAFRQTGLLAHLQGLGVRQLTIAGMMTHMCIDTTVRAAFDLGFESTLAHDACATKALSFGGTEVTAAEVQATFLAALDGTFAKVRSAAEIRANLGNGR